MQVLTTFFTTVKLLDRVDRDLAHQKKSLTDRELITLARQHDRRGLLPNDPEVDVKLRTR